MLKDEIRRFICPCAQKKLNMIHTPLRISYEGVEENSEQLLKVYKIKNAISVS
jgi:hypothetical protein